ncbi:bifunctional [glutamate--ammonia ligase]-adenylyl-L-tyrosine phosphorylase/[glutamate--ammonia-ligase] adenylyltransferase [Chitinibacter bivalviorum]|uniref:Bifunctional glutamine synthetase adenylyltransferase/adenylyl-removing enzyme n=1 Tax=Chitinibacter bivalviorum TaxID=2739434 RepID=A0A7H9BG04_9NEIS|nr:bifunctional [glutamate--ammonia ligase]-adenylyl-L-tyrosine phosphorylase/[glutamate--ammonia-ligase] adenylyltransferase [Chitinibacter bivalviorum]QLG87176.1 bifunctional [glutamate--ammonia ligase]-adenylyl-L-tyrosine phosphorylase/[glutamate--ammonia-ligase] adenylyltransferase [Chitinibacter bivalviorum]
MTENIIEAHPQLISAQNHSRYLQRLFLCRPALAQETAEHATQAFHKAEMQLRLLAKPAQSEEELAMQLRHLRQAVMARLVVREINGLSDLKEAMHTITDLAEVAVETALAWVSKPDERYGQPIGEETGEVQQLIVVGMGKLGERELNVSSDIDLIFVYPEDGETTGPRKISNHEYFANIGKRLIRLIGDTDANGFVFRVDMRLRPFGDSGPLVTSFAALENYLLTQGREWERYAWIKGRALTGDEQGLMDLVTPFVYRKYLDYGAYHSMRELHSQIRREVERKDRLDNVKLGPGGIREIEFIGQVFQLIRGGRNKTLRSRATQAILNELAAQGNLPQDVVTELQAAYVFLRDVEHRIMYLDDAQTQMLPSNEEDQHKLAISMGFGDWAQFRAALDAHRTIVSKHFEEVFLQPEQNTPTQDETEDPIDAFSDGNTPYYQQLGYQNPAEIQRRLTAMQDSSKYRQMPDRCRRRLDSILPSLISTTAQFGNPDATLMRLLDLLDAISRRESYLALLAEHPQTLKRLASLYSASPWVSEYLTRHPILLDELLDFRLLHQEPEWDKLGRILRQEMNELADDIEARMDCLRHFQHSQIFRLVSQDLAGLLPLERLSDHLSDLADLILSVALEQAWKDLPNKHREQANFAIIGYGKLGGKELGFASDLDIVYLYDDDHANAPEIYARLAKRIVNWLTSLTSAGQLYDIDLRLRPNGSSGLLVSTVQAFSEYQHQSAWVWEHQAITRARFCAGDTHVGKNFEQIRHDILCKERDIAALQAEVLKMRNKMLETHPALAHDVKHRRGGIVDIEFIVQFLILAHARTLPQLTANAGNIALLDVAAQHHLISSHAAEHARTAYRELRRLQHTHRLNGTELSLAMIEPLTLEMNAVQALWEQLFPQP